MDPLNKREVRDRSKSRDIYIANSLFVELKNKICLREK